MSEASSFISTSEPRRPSSLAWEGLALAAWIFICHLIVSSLVAAYLAAMHTHRMVNLKHWPIGEWPAVMDRQVGKAHEEAAAKGRRTLFFLGSSVTYGFPYEGQWAFTRWVADDLPGYQAANLGVVGVGMEAVADIASCSLVGRRRPDLLVVEIPLVNSTSSLRASAYPFKPSCEGLPAVGQGWWRFAFDRPLGMAWVSSLLEETVRPDHGKEMKAPQLPSDFFVGGAQFATMENKYQQVLVRYLDQVGKMADRVFVFVSPVYIQGVQAAGGDSSAIEYQIALSQAVCKSHGLVVCLDVTDFLSKKELYGNLTHFNVEGNMEFGSWLVKEINKNLIIQK